MQRYELLDYGSQEATEIEKGSLSLQLSSSL